MDHNILITIQDPIVSSIYYNNWWHSGIHCGFRCYSQCNCIYPSISKSRKSYRPILHETSTHSNVKDKQVGFTLIANLRRMLHNVLPVSAAIWKGMHVPKVFFPKSMLIPNVRFLHTSRSGL